MKNSRSSFLLVTLLGVVASGLLFSMIGHARKSSAQDFEKSLDIERHANEPLELIDIKVSEQSVKNKIGIKRRNGDEGMDNVKFRDKDDWHKRLRVRLRNVSGKTITGFSAYLYFKPPGSPMLFSVTLKGSSTQLEGAVLEPRDEIEAMVDDGSWDRMVNRLRQYGGDANVAAVTLSVEIVAFNDGLQWRRGHTLRVDPDNPNRRIPIETKSPPEVSRSNRPDQFRTVGFRPDEAEGSWGKSVALTFTRRPPQANARCVLNNDSGNYPLTE